MAVNDIFFFYLLQQAGVQLPGVLGGWRSDIQGKQRADSPRQDTDRDVVVTTSYGKVQGFLVNLYDNPIPKTGFRPNSGQVERIQAKVCVFLGIPYALPPINEGRFKVRLVGIGLNLLKLIVAKSVHCVQNVVCYQQLARSCNTVPKIS